MYELLLNNKGKVTKEETGNFQKGGWQLEARKRRSPGHLTGSSWSFYSRFFLVDDSPFFISAYSSSAAL